MPAHAANGRDSSTAVFTPFNLTAEARTNPFCKGDRLVTFPDSQNQISLLVGNSANMSEDESYPFSKPSPGEHPLDDQAELEEEPTERDRKRKRSPQHPNTPDIQEDNARPQYSDHQDTDAEYYDPTGLITPSAVNSRSTVSSASPDLIMARSRA
uniref:Uncharacterized protein n=1 Tax=Ananas comosus var. bracteatus TaxID=296719 RepID=A0A6V7QS00_ANACO